MKVFTQGPSEQYLKQVHEEALYVLSVQQQKMAAAAGSVAGQQTPVGKSGSGIRVSRTVN